MKRFSFLLFVYIFMFSFFGIAQDTTNIFERKELNFADIQSIQKSNMEVYSASRSAKKITDLPVTVYVVTAEEIQRNGYVTLTDVLKTVPGIKVSQPGNAAQGETFLMRGFLGNYYTKILLNGLPVSPSVSGEMVIGPHLPIRQAQRIEIIYGPASAVYGADATTGVINIITKQPDNKTFANSDIYVGQNGYTNYDFIVGGKAGKYQSILKYSIYGNRTQLDDLDVYWAHEVYSPINYSQFYNSEVQLGGDTYSVAEITPEILAGYGIDEQTFLDNFAPENYEGTLSMPETDKLPEKSNSLGMNIQFKNFSLDFYHSYYQLHSAVGMLPFFYKYDNQMNYTGHYTSKASLSYQKSWRLFTVSSAASYLHYNLDNYSSQGITYLSNGIIDTYMYAQSDDFFTEHLLTFHPSDKFELVSGISYQLSANLPVINQVWKPFDFEEYNPFGQNNLQDSFYGEFGFNPITYTNEAFFVQAFWKLWRFNLVFGARFDENSLYSESEIFGQSVNPRFALTYKQNDNLVFRSSIGTATKAPAANKIYYSVAIPAGENNDSIEYAFIPNPQLSPEMFAALELGARYTYKNKLDVDISLYANSISNQIVARKVSSQEMPELPLMVNSGMTFTRTYSNKKDVIGSLLGIQVYASMKDIIPSIQMGAELNFSLTAGSEILPETEEIFKQFRQMPNRMAKFKLYATPFRNFYLNIETIAMSGWYRSYIPFKAQLPDSYIFTDGYWTQDILASYNLSKQFKVFLNVKNVFNAHYAGIDASGVDVDLQYNPQQTRNIRLGVNFSLD